MKLLQRLPTETHITKSGKTALRSYGLFYCDCCNTEVKKETTIGFKAKCCGSKECKTKAGFGHGFHNTKIYQAWNGLKQRCDNPNHPKYHRYGGRGITYPESWNTFMGFYSEMGSSYKEGYSIDRINNDKNYSKSNCKWIPVEENSAKDKRIPIAQYTTDGEYIKYFKSVKDAALELDFVSATSLRRVIDSGKEYKGFIWKSFNTE